MKKFLAGLVVLFVLMVTLPLTAEAHNSCPRHRKARKSYAARNYQNSVNRQHYAANNAANNYGTRGYNTYNRPSFYRRHRNLVNLGIATGGGALIGGIARGKKGAGIGALVGAGSGALYTYVLNKKKRRY